jgi:hypothetical protein
MHGEGGHMTERPGHAAEPEAGTFRRADGGEADLFRLADYPVDAVCQVCGAAIRARSFASRFEHVEPERARDPDA